jgi:hypothetical protein
MEGAAQSRLTRIAIWVGLKVCIGSRNRLEKLKKGKAESD